MSHNTELDFKIKVENTLIDAEKLIISVSKMKTTKKYKYVETERFTDYVFEIEVTSYLQMALAHSLAVNWKAAVNERLRCQMAKNKVQMVERLGDKTAFELTYCRNHNNTEQKQSCVRINFKILNL